VRNIDKLYGSAMVDRSSSRRWEKRVTASETGKSELHDLPRDRFFGTSKSNAKPRGKKLLPSCWQALMRVSNSEEQLKSGSFILNWRQKQTMEWHYP